MQAVNLFTDDSLRDALAQAPDIKGKQYIEHPNLDKLAENVMEAEQIDIGPAEIGYMLVYPKISKKKAGVCKTCNGELEYYSGNNYLIQFSGELWDMLTPQSQYILMWHELLHVKPVYNSKTGEWKFALRDHDFEDFYEINEKHGLDWLKTIKGGMSSLYDLHPDEEDEVSL